MSTNHPVTTPSSPPSSPPPQDQDPRREPVPLEPHWVALIDAATD
jgi:hypothetical protein